MPGGGIKNYLISSICLWRTRREEKKLVVTYDTMSINELKLAPWKYVNYIIKLIELKRESLMRERRFFFFRYICITQMCFS